MGLWENNLPTRVPEYLQGEPYLEEYLEVCGSIYDKMVDTIKEHDVYKDYKRVPQQRLSLLARRFAFEPTAPLPDDTVRGIIRDISVIYKTRGIEESIKWVFKILSWDAKIEYAWLPDPERFDDRLSDVYESEYGDDDPLGKDAEYNIRIDDPYRINDKQPIFHLDSDFIFTDYLKIGTNDLLYVGIGDAYSPTPIAPVDPDYIENLDYREFLYGKAHTGDDGTYFTGRWFFEDYDSAQNLRIIGERYDEKIAKRNDRRVMSTPYIAVRLYGENFEKFTQPVVDDDGNVYSYTETEKYRVANLLIQYLFHDLMRPANVKVLLFSQESPPPDPDNPDDPRNMVEGFVIGGDVLTQTSYGYPDNHKTVIEIKEDLEGTGVDETSDFFDSYDSEFRIGEDLQVSDGSTDPQTDTGDGVSMTDEISQTETVNQLSESHLFGSGEIGGFYDPSDLSTMWKDVAGTIAVTSNGDSVARIDDKSGNGYHLVQSDTSKQPTYNTDGTLHWLTFDGVDDCLSCGSVSLGGEALVCIGIEKTGDTSQSVVELTDDPTHTDGSLYVSIDSTNIYTFGSKGTSGSTEIYGGTSGANKGYFLFDVDLVNNNSELTINGSSTATDLTDTGTNSFASAAALNVGARGGTSNQFGGKIFGLVVRDSKSGVYKEHINDWLDKITNG